MIHEHRPISNDPRPHGFLEAAARYRMHPLTVITLFGVDHALAALEISSLGLFAVVSVFVGCVLVLPITLIQRRECGQSWEVAAAVGVIVSVLIAIPTPIGSYIGGFFAAAPLLFKKPPTDRGTIDTDGEER